ncbi:hypothetical protein FRC11_013983, partial [Ceratobasidium sp. 423]
MSEGTCSQSPVDDGLDDELKLEVSVTFVSDSPASAGLKKANTKNPPRRTKVFTTFPTNLTLSAFFQNSLDALGLQVTDAGSVPFLPFAYSHRGRTARNALSATNEGNFKLMVEVVKSRSLTSLQVVFHEAELILLVDHLVTIIEPPNHEAFDFSEDQHQVNAHPPMPPYNAQTVLNGLYQLFTSANPTLAASSTATPGLATPAASDPQPTPITSASDPLLPFLGFARKGFGVGPSDEYFDILIRERIGPDVLQDVQVLELENYGVPKGDIYRLKRAAQSWEEGEERSHPFKAPRLQGSGDKISVGRAPTFTVAFDDCPSPPPADYQPTDAKRAGRPHQGKKGVT